MSEEIPSQALTPQGDQHQAEPQADENTPAPKEIGGRKGPEPTRYGDWEFKGRCIDF
ncbi:MAG: DUF1674 domain-containing protein [Gammaproteobacteria bacterium]|nr:DUF1674 domain-containing protein [Gammaproteobacteria bacterium]